MDEKIKPLIRTDELKMSLLKSLINQKKLVVELRYDSNFDALVLLLVPTTDAIVHYINDDNIALLFQSQTKEIVGIQIEDFVYSFLPHHHAVQKVWRLSDSEPNIKDVGDLIFAFERIKPQIVREVFKATEDLWDREGLELGALVSIAPEI